MKDLNQHMTAEEYRRLHGADTPEKKRPKVPCHRTEYNGVMYDSKLEADMAKSLELMQREGIVNLWTAQYPEFTLPIKNKKGDPRKYTADFLVNCGPLCLNIIIDMKGPWTDYHNPRQADRRQMVEQKYNIKIHVCHTVKEAENVILRAIE